MILRRVPVAVLAADHFLVGGDAGELEAAEVDVRRQIDAIVRIVQSRLGPDIEARRRRERRIEVPAGDIAGGVRRNGDRTTGSIRAGVRLQQVQPGFVGFVLGQMEFQQEIDGIRRLPFQLPAAGDFVPIAEALPGIPVALPIAALLGGQGQTPQQSGGERSGDIPLRRHCVERTVLGREAGMRVFGRPVGDEIDLAARGVAAIESPLRTAQHLDAVDVEQLTRRLMGNAKATSSTLTPMGDALFEV